MRDLIRGTSTDLASLLHGLEVGHSIAGTRVTSHCHVLNLDGNGRPMIGDLVQAMKEAVLDYAIPRKRMAQAVAEASASGSGTKLMRLADEAVGLFADVAKSGEGGELLLFLLAEKLLGLPQLLCKMDLKTNRRVHVHGADGIHAGVNDDGRLVLFFGESKIYADPIQAIRDCLSSLAPVLLDPAASKRDVQLLQRYREINDAALDDALGRYLDPDDPLHRSFEIRGLCLVGFDSDHYPSQANMLKLAGLVELMMTEIPAWKTQINRRASKEKVLTFGMHFICLPLPDVEAFRLLLLQKLGISLDVAAPTES